MTFIFSIIHVFSIASLFGTCVGACVSPVAENRKKMLMFSGIASLLIFISGFGMAGMLHLGFPGWILVKILCWLTLSVVVGMFFRKPEKRAMLIKLCALTLLVALTMVYLRPF